MYIYTITCIFYISLWTTICFNYLTYLEYCRTIIMHNVQITRFAYMYNIPNNQLLESENLFIPSLLHLAAMKAHALWQRAKWKNYVDLYFLIKKFWIKKIVTYTKDFLGGEFNEKLFLSQLSYFDDINRANAMMRNKSRKD